jgi:prolyl-tRNA editing enzyme YbaK/EbsC (Cys-tRNA(Pro) deacylase)
MSAIEKEPKSERAGIEREFKRGALERDSEVHTLSTAWEIKPAQIAKTLVLRAGDQNILLVSCGDSPEYYGRLRQHRRLP